MRYIGNKTRLLPFIRRTLERGGIEVGSVHDAFAGTASVSRALKADGWKVYSSDLLASSFVFQRAYVVADSVNDCIGDLAAALSGLEPIDGFITRHFSPQGGRMYFSVENAQRIDAAREELDRWKEHRAIDADTYYVLLAGLIEGADRVANTAGVYASYMKRWQANAKRRFQVDVETPVPGAQKAEAYLMDAIETAKLVGPVDLVYIDPPYNSRQYVAYYHIPEILARGWSAERPAIRGKVGLLAGNEGRSDWSHGRRVQKLFGALLAASEARYALVSFNSEGHLQPEVLISLLVSASGGKPVGHFSQRYRRYRADSERTGRHYHRDSALEHLYLVQLK